MSSLGQNPPIFHVIEAVLSGRTEGIPCYKYSLSNTEVLIQSHNQTTIYVLEPFITAHTLVFLNTNKTSFYLPLLLPQAEY